MQHDATEQFKLNIGHIVDIACQPQSKVVGIDHYQMQAIDGKDHEWTSYTLVAGDAKNRWWITVSSELGIYVWQSISTIAEYETAFANAGQLEKVTPMSGLARLKTEGDTAQTSNVCYLDVVKTPSGSLLSAEKFDGDKPFLFRADPIKRDAINVTHLQP